MLNNVVTTTVPHSNHMIQMRNIVDCIAFLHKLANYLFNNILGCHCALLTVINDYLEHAVV